MTICEGYLKLLTRLADPEDSLTHDDVDYELAVGEDDSTAPSFTDTSLNAQVGQTNVTDYINEGTTLYTSTFIDSTEANPDDGSAYQSLVEYGVFAICPDETYLCNHSLISEIQKTEGKNANIEARLTLDNDPNDA